MLYTSDLMYWSTDTRALFTTMVGVKDGTFESVDGCSLDGGGGVGDRTPAVTGDGVVGAVRATIGADVTGTGATYLGFSTHLYMRGGTKSVQVSFAAHGSSSAHSSRWLHSRPGELSSMTSCIS
jgi:hypothetical protein